MYSSALHEELKAPLLAAVADSDLPGASRRKIASDLSVSLITFREDTLEFSASLCGHDFDDYIKLSYVVTPNDVPPFITDEQGDDICHESAHLTATLERTFWRAGADFTATLTDTVVWPASSIAAAATDLASLFLKCCVQHGVPA